MGHVSAEQGRIVDVGGKEMKKELKDLVNRS
jgi:hypothetical protein